MKCKKCKADLTNPYEVCSCHHIAERKAFRGKMTKPFGPPNEDDGRDDERADTCHCSLNDREQDSYIHHGEWDEIFHYCKTCGGMIE